MTDGLDDWDDYNAEREMAPEGSPEELVHLAMTCNGAWGLSLKDALQMRQHMDAGKPPVGDSTWTQELEDVEKLLGAKAYDAARRIAWAAYLQGILHGEFLSEGRG